MLSFKLPFTATKLQAATYLFGVCLFSISFLVFLNSSISFVITDRIGQKKKVGDAVGTLGFADELVALIACPLWGMLSDRIGVRNVAVAGYAVVGISLFALVQARNVYPELLLGRLLFSIGGAATTTMVTAILPSMTHKEPRNTSSPTSESTPIGNGPSHCPAPSISSELTITPARYRTFPPPISSTPPTTEPSASKLAGIVGMLTGCGALVALGLFLPLPTRFQKGGTSASQSVADSFYLVGAMAICVSICCFFGLRNLPGEEGKRFMHLFPGFWSFNSHGTLHAQRPLPSYLRMLRKSAILGFQDVNIGLGYVGGFVARASSVAISLFIPLYVNAYFISSGLCPEDPDDSMQDPGEIKRNCQRAYVIASILSGMSQLVALICAPIFGYLSGIYKTSNLPLLLASASGVAGYATFGKLKSPDTSRDDGNFGVFFIVALLGISQIGAIVCSLSLLAKGIETEVSDMPDSFQALSVEDGTTCNENGHDFGGEESAPLLLNHLRHIKDVHSSRSALKGSIAGIYSLSGGAGILLLTKVGGLMFDKVDVGSPFFMMAIFNAILFLASLACDLGRAWQTHSDEDDRATLRGRLEDDGSHR
ncbi:uncharacterized protein PV09_00689 [Verruconis gallopava]|uniref:Major facilitator superfamily (MFS) profile domain-containing protein n=1 Tax=Verruconis gallopava TaxID=253628 RepID=A0A0D1Y0Z0_9PEZI|nr:uncharacterized protein PV09_00689 [Verruconis gallopava]KIW08751.1 hypothetical protein PV09_00689 [Verruconis gallopava]